MRRDGVGDWLLIATLSGKGRFGHAEGELVVEPGEWVLIRPGTPHDYGVEASLKQWELLWVHFQPRPHWLPWLNWPAVAPGLFKLTIDETTLERFREVHRLFISDLRRSDTFAMNALEAVLLECDRQNPLAATSSYDERICRAMDYLERNIARKTTLADIAGAVGLSSSRLAHLFREQTGQTPQQYLEGIRMQRASELLRRTLPARWDTTASSTFRSASKPARNRVQAPSAMALRDPSPDLYAVCRLLIPALFA